MARNPHLEKPNGGALKPSAVMGTPKKVPMKRVKPKEGYLNGLPADTQEEALAEAPEGITVDDLQRAYLVEVRILEKTWADSPESYPLVRLFYATAPKASRVCSLETTEGIEEESTGEYQFTEEADNYRSSILICSDAGRPPQTFMKANAEEMQSEYQEILRNRHGIE